MLKHVYVNFVEPKPVVIVSDNNDYSMSNVTQYLGVMDLTNDQINFPEYAVDGIKVAPNAKADFENSNLEFQKAILKKLAKEKELEKINEGFLYNGNRFDSDTKAQIFIGGLLTAINAGIVTGSIDFTTKDNIDIPLTVNQITELAGTLLGYVQACHEWKREKYIQIDACNSIEGLREIAW